MIRQVLRNCEKRQVTVTPVVNRCGELVLTHIVVPGATCRINFDPIATTGKAFSPHHQFMLHKNDSNRNHWMSEECRVHDTWTRFKITYSVPSMSQSTSHAGLCASAHQGVL